MPALYDKLGLRFLYPDNWILDESEAASGEETITIYSPGGAFWFVRLHDGSVEPARVIDTALAAMRKEYTELDAEAFDDTLGAFELLGCEMNFYCLDLTNTARAQSFRSERGTVLVFYQADDREFAEVETIFEAMLTSLLQNMQPAAGR